MKSFVNTVLRATLYVAVYSAGLSALFAMHCSADEAPGASSSAASLFAFEELSANKTTSGALQLSEGGKPVYVYNFGPVLAAGFPEEMRRSCYLHPVYSPAGVKLTDDFNQDHPHHRGISWMWPEVTVDGRKGDVWMVKQFKQRFVAWKARETKSDSARLSVANGWFDGDKKFVDEEVEIVAHRAENGRRKLDFALSFTALDGPVEIIGTSEGKKGFGGFCFRMAPRDGGAAQTIIRTEKGLAAKDAVLAPHAWAEITGRFDGREAGARLEDDPGNPNYPHNGWLLRHGFGFMNVSYPGLKPLVLEPGKPLALKYHVILFDGPGSTK
jgi:hypothetical protein